jgi:Tfp pilus assembly protein FimV
LGDLALTNNVSGSRNTAIGDDALDSCTTGDDNVAVGNEAGNSVTNSSGHTLLGEAAGNGITGVDNNIVIGHLSGVHSVFGQVSNRCFIDNIFGAAVNNATFAFVLVDSDGRLGTVTVSNGIDQGGFSPQPAPRQAVPEPAKQAMINLNVEKLQAKVGQQQKQIETLTRQLRDQAAQIQKVSAQLEASKFATGRIRRGGPAPRVVVNKP